MNDINLKYNLSEYCSLTSIIVGFILLWSLIRFIIIVIIINMVEFEFVIGTLGKTDRR